MIDLYKGDCLEVMKNISDNSIDAIITDPPYGTTACKWDSVIDFTLMWEQLNRIIKPNGAIVLFGSEPFSSALRMSNIKNYKYDWVWEKTMPSGMATSKFMPMKYHEIISIFVNNGKPTFNKQMQDRSEVGKQRLKNNGKILNGKNSKGSHTEKNSLAGTYSEYDVEKVNPKTILKFKSVPNCNGTKLHPTQKPILLMEYLISTYTNEGELVLDFTMGSGTTGVAAKNLNRNFIGIEMDENYFNIASDRIGAQ
jgi:site-specific DNA-methyltransferase (adenine-specific)